MTYEPRTDWPHLTLASGPVDVPLDTLRALQRPIVYHYDPVFIEEFRRVEALLKQVFRTNHDVIIMQGEAVLALEAAAASVIRPGTKVLNLVSGVFGAGYAGWIERYGGEVIEIRVPYDRAIDPEEVSRTLAEYPEIEVLAAVHCETPSGTMNPIGAIGRIAQEHGVLTIVDTVSGLGAEVYSPEEWGIDIAVAGAQKCLGGVPGLSLVAVSPRAWEVMESVDTPLRGSYLSVLDWKDTWIDSGRFPYTPSVADVHALESTLELAVEEGMEAMAARHQAVAVACRAAVRGLGLELWPASDDIAAPGCTAVRVPDGTAAEAIIETMRSRYGVMISGGYGDLSGKLFRLGHMGQSAHPTTLFAQIGVLERSLLDLGVSITPGTGVGAAIDALAGWGD
ncbi:MAG: alanine--glyoxylate aminotransferase family protein [Chloroflexota bacterium]|nr:alanine--glyoxylate aminotransferase family protein [Chloroflexota bacterium]